MKQVAIGLLALLALFSGILAFQYFTAPIRGQVAVHERVNSADNRIDSYNSFFDACAAIQGYEATIFTQQMGFDAATTPEDKSRFQVNLVAVKSQRLRAISQYNVDVRKVATKAKFMDTSLPLQINEANPHTSCTN